MDKRKRHIEGKEEGLPKKKRPRGINFAEGRIPRNAHFHIAERLQDAEGGIPQIDPDKRSHFDEAIGLLKTLQGINQKLFGDVAKKIKSAEYQTELEACYTLRDHIREKESPPLPYKVLSAVAIITDAVQKREILQDTRDAFNTHIDILLSSHNMARKDLKCYLPPEMQRDSREQSPESSEKQTTTEKASDIKTAGSSTSKVAEGRSQAPNLGKHSQEIVSTSPDPSDKQHDTGQDSKTVVRLALEEIKEKYLYNLIASLDYNRKRNIDISSNSEMTEKIEILVKDARQLFNSLFRGKDIANADDIMERLIVGVKYFEESKKFFLRGEKHQEFSAFVYKIEKRPQGQSGL